MVKHLRTSIYGFSWKSWIAFYSVVCERSNLLPHCHFLYCLFPHCLLHLCMIDTVCCDEASTFCLCGSPDSTCCYDPRKLWQVSSLTRTWTSTGLQSRWIGAAKRRALFLTTFWEKYSNSLQLELRLAVTGNVLRTISFSTEAHDV